MRNESMTGEILLWQGLKGKKMLGYTFNRQKPLLNYIADFYCKVLSF
jgi:very-short-patch-repair endonuclease